MDGGAVFGPVARTQWAGYLKPDRFNRVMLGLNCLLVRSGELNILIDTGAGSKSLDDYSEKFRLNGNKLMRGLRAEGLTPREIHMVVLTNLRFDRAGGCTKLDRKGKLLPTFPRATYIVQSAALDDARDPGERSAPFYNADDLIPLVEAGKVKTVEGNAQVAPGVSVMPASGPWPGHQVVLVDLGSERIIFPGDLLPTPLHMTPRCITAFDDSPNETLANKREILSMAVEKGWMVVFPQALEQYSGYVEGRAGQHSLRPVEL